MDGTSRRLDIAPPAAGRTPKVGEQAAKRLADHILANDITPGTALPPEKELAEMLGIGRGTMREALRILEIFGMLDMRTGRYGGPVVRRPDDNDLARALTLSFQANGSSMLDVMETRSFIEPHLASLAARRITVEQLEGLQATIDQMREPGITNETFQQLAREFHTLVAQAANSPVLSLLAVGLHKIGGGDVVGIAYGPVQVEGTAKAHERILSALTARDSERAAEYWGRHLREAERFWRKDFSNEAAAPVRWTL
ncbi:FadR/GntR family transcriptional regulator [Dactylosporangium sp. NPDC000555]|uniref:FadR/GntR family transcriptional regulator n=1 Tax=Dactylosporangium sp. NPDC000555 TaxID=3154260 RepID=UPI00331E9389